MAPAIREGRDAVWGGGSGRTRATSTGENAPRPRRCVVRDQRRPAAPPPPPLRRRFAAAPRRATGARGGRGAGGPRNHRRTEEETQSLRVGRYKLQATPAIAVDVEPPGAVGEEHALLATSFLVTVKCHARGTNWVST